MIEWSVVVLFLGHILQVFEQTTGDRMVCYVTFLGHILRVFEQTTGDRMVCGCVIP